LRLALGKTSIDRAAGDTLALLPRATLSWLACAEAAVGSATVRGNFADQQQTQVRVRTLFITILLIARERERTSLYTRTHAESETALPLPHEV
jgi:hypothetical protein